MLLRNLVTIFLTTVFSLACYEKVQWNRKAATISEAMTLIERNYLEEVSARALFDAAMRGMMSILDVNSAYMEPAEFQPFHEGLNQRFGGIGVMVEVSPITKRPTVISPMKDSPAEQAGIRAGDTIVTIEGRDTLDMPLEAAVKLIHGKVGEPVHLGLTHGNETEVVRVSVTRAEIKVDSVRGDARRADASWEFALQEDPRIAYLRVVTFGERTLEELRAALTERGTTGLAPQAILIDLRENAGGLLPAAIGACDLFLDQGVIVSTRGRNGVEARRYEAAPDLEVPKDIPVVILVNRNSASASEIVAACLQDHGRAIIVGQRSYGKGTVQNVIPLEGGRSGLKLTTASYWRPSGKNIHRRKDATDEDDWGVRPTPGFEVPVTPELQRKIELHRHDRDLKIPGAPTARPPDADPSKSTTPEAVDDPQLRKAIEYLQAKIGPPSPSPTPLSSGSQ